MNSSRSSRRTSGVSPQPPKWLILSVFSALISMGSAAHAQLQEDELTLEAFADIELPATNDELTFELEDALDDDFPGEAEHSNDFGNVPETGEEIFKHRWQPGEPLAGGGGDGLGPMHNDVSCVACHFQGGVGGGGSVDKNAILLSIASNASRTAQRVDFTKLAERLHPGFLQQRGLPGFPGQLAILGVKSPSAKATALRRHLKQQMVFRTNDSILLHKYSTDARYDELLERFEQFALPFGSDPKQHQAAIGRLATAPVGKDKQGKTQFAVSQRNTPALFGTGAIDRIPRQQLVAIAQKQRNLGIVSGRLSTAKNSTSVGKFGWKGQTESLAAFVRAACANELGLNVPGAKQAPNPFAESDANNGKLDLNQRQLLELTSFIADLPQPEELEPDDVEAAKIAHHGRKLFATTGCIHCHVEAISGRTKMVSGIYSDLLLHDMGKNLADPVPSGGTFSPSAGGGSSYSGGSSSPSAELVSSGRNDPRLRSRRVMSVSAQKQQEWRTPPLWGVASTAPYMHDGRAATLSEAILYHGGEAQFSVKKYLRLPPEDRLAIVAFLNTLVAPMTDEI